MLASSSVWLFGHRNLLSSLIPRRQHFLQMTVPGVCFLVKLKVSLIPLIIGDHGELAASLSTADREAADANSVAFDLHVSQVGSSGLIVGPFAHLSNHAHQQTSTSTTLLELQ